MVLTNNIIKQVASLAHKKYRTENGCFTAEGTKCVRDTWDSFNCRWLIATKTWYEQCGHAGHYEKLLLADKGQMARMSQFSTPSDVIAVYDLPEYTLDISDLANELTIVLDTGQDPGNLGTIIRIADWFGVKNIVCSDTTVDAFSHKVIQATMGAISRVKVHYCDLDEFLTEASGLPIYGTYLEGSNIYDANLKDSGLLIMGNEGRGISPKLEKYVTHKLHIPTGLHHIGVAECRCCHGNSSERVP